MHGQHWRRWCALALLGALLGLEFEPFRLVVVSGHSMEPALHDRQVALMDRSWYRHHRIARGDMVICHLDGEWMVKRVEGLPGQQVRWLNGYEWRRGRFVPSVLHEVVPDRHIFLLGDNRNVSMDSRWFGPVPVDSIVGRLQPL